MTLKADTAANTASTTSTEIEAFLSKLAEKHQVSDRCLEQIRPALTTIFEDFRGSERDRLLRLAEETVERQAASEARVREVTRVIDESIKRLEAQEQERVKAINESLRRAREMPRININMMGNWPKAAREGGLN